MYLESGKYYHIYNHANGFVNKAEEWLYSSYNDILRNQCDIVECKAVVKWFHDLRNFIACHKTTPNIDSEYSFE